MDFELGQIPIAVEDMIYIPSVDQVIAYVSQFITLKIGDLIFTGTPEGVGPIKIGDRLEGFIEGNSAFKLNYLRTLKQLNIFLNCIV